MSRRIHVILGTIVALLVASPASAQIVLIPGSQYPVPQQPRSIAAADFNGDGRADVAVTDPGSGTLTVLFGSGDGAFASSLNLALPDGLGPLVAGDLNCDGNADIAVVSSVADRVFVITGNGDGTFNAPATYLNEAAAVDIALGNFDAQSCNDLAVLDQADGRVRIFLNLGRDRGFAVHDFAVGASPKRVAAADLNGDGFDDLAIITSPTADADAVSILLNAGDGSFGTPHDFTVGTGAKDLTVGDFNNDGAPDIAALNAGATAILDEYSVSVLLNRVETVGGQRRGTGFFDAAIPVPLRRPYSADGVLILSNPNFLTTGDFDLDGSLDLAVSFSTHPQPSSTVTPGLIIAFGGHGDGTFDFATEVSIGFDPEDIVARDFDGTGGADIAFAEMGSRAVHIVRTGAPQPPPPVGCGVDRQCAAGLFCVGGVCCASPSCGLSVTIGLASGEPGDVVTVEVALMTGGAPVAGIQNDFVYDPAVLSTKPHPGSVGLGPAPDCAVNPTINKGSTGFALRCTPDGQCNVRAVVFALGNTDPIPDGSVLYTCRLRIADDAPPGRYPLAISNVVGSDPMGRRLEVTGVDGAIDVLTPPGATPIPTHTATPITTPRPSAAPQPIATRTPTVTPPPAVQLTVGSAAGGPDDRASIAVSLRTAGNSVAATQNDIDFDPRTLAVAADASGQPECTVDPAINKKDAAFAFLPDGCQPDTNCTGVRALVFALDNVNPIPDTAVLYTCTVQIGHETPPGTYPLVLAAVVASDPNGREWPARGTDGTITVITPPGATPIPTYTPALQPPPVSLPVEPVGPPEPVGSVTHSNTGGGGCSISSSAPVHRSAILFLVLPAALLVSWRARR